MFPRLSDHMVWAIKRDAVAEHQPHIRNELLCTIVMWIVSLEGLDDMSLRSILPRSIGFLIMLGQWGMLRETGSTGRKNAPASLSFLSERIVDRQKRCCKELIVDMLVPIGVGGAVCLTGEIYDYLT
jgi:hypothetical protein